MRMPPAPSRIADWMARFIARRNATLRSICCAMDPATNCAMLYAPRGMGKSFLSLSIGLSVAAGVPLLRWHVPRQRRVLYVDGEMPMVSLQERLRALSASMGGDIPNHGLRMLAADQIETGIKLGTEEGQLALQPLLEEVDLLILDNISTL